MATVHDIRTIVFATDFSTFSEDARAYVTALGSRFGAHVVVVHAVEPIPTFDDPQDRDTEAWHAALRDDMQQKLDAEIADLRSGGIDAEGRLLDGSPWKEILRTGVSMGADLIVVGSHGLRTPDGQVLLGTTSHKVALSSSIPVLIVRYGRKTTP